MARMHPSQGRPAEFDSGTTQTMRQAKSGTVEKELAQKPAELREYVPYHSFRDHKDLNLCYLRSIIEALARR
jgi:hypothetical protein